MALSGVAVVGVGRMGGAIVRRLVAEGHVVRIWNRDVEASRHVAASLPAGTVEVATSATEAVADVAVVLCMLSDGESTLAVLGHDELIEAAHPRTVVVNLATTGPRAARRLAEVLAGRRLVDAPVSGSVATVRSGELVIMASGAAEDIDDARSVLSSFAGTILHVGPYGSGQVMKLGLNLVLLGVNALVSEALVLVERAGVDAAAAYDVLEASVVSSSFVRYKRTAFLDDSSPVAMNLELTAKDMRLIRDLAEQVGADLAVTRAVEHEVQAAVDHGYGPKDMASLRRYVDVGSSP